MSDGTTDMGPGKQTVAMLALGLALAGMGSGNAAAQQTGARVTYADILAAPDDLDLNLRYARQEVASGRLQQAASALERMLLSEPNWDSARLFYGIVLYRLADLEGAIRELTVLEGRSLTAAQERDRVRYLALARKANDPLRLTSRFSLGARYDTNPNRAAESSAFFDEDDDVAFAASSRFRAEHDVALNPGDYVFFQTNGYLSAYLNTNVADFLGSRQKLGVALHGARVVVTPYLHSGFAYVDDDLYRREGGAGLDALVGLGGQLSLNARYRVSWQDFSRTGNSTIGSRRDGVLHAGALGLRWRPIDKQIFRLTGTLADKDAKDDGFSYREAGVSLRSHTLLGEGLFVTLGAEYRRRDYEAIDNFYTRPGEAARDENRFKARAAVGAPLSFLFSQFDVELPEAIADIVAQAGVSYLHQDANVDRLDFENWSGDLLFTKRIRF